MIESQIRNISVSLVKKVPNLRFRPFNNDWKALVVAESYEVQMCKRIFASQTSESGDVPFYKIGTIGGQADAYISYELFNQYRSRYHFPNQGETLITCSGTVGRCIQYDGRPAYFQDSNIVWLHGDRSPITSNFLFRLLSKRNWKTLNTTTISRIYSSDLLGLRLFYPPIVEEQERISDFLSLLDQRIEVQNKIIEELETFEKTFWNCLLNEEGCLLESIGNMFFVSKEKLGSGPQIPVYTASAKEGLIDEERYFKKKVSGNDKSNYQIVRKGDYVFSKSSSRDAPFGAFIRFEDEIGIVSPLYWVLRPKQEIDENLIRIWFSSSFAAKQFQSKCQEGARNHGMLNISLSDFLTIKMWKSLPQPILECKRLINAKLEKAKEQTKLFQQEKSFLLKAMFI